MGKHEHLARLLRKAAPNHGLFSVADAEAEGLSQSALGRMVDDGLLERVAPGLLRGAHLTWSLEARQAQAIATVGRGAVLGARSALHHWGVIGRPDRIELLVPWGCGGTTAEVRLLQSKDITPVDVVWHGALETSTPARAIIDAARFLGPLALEQAISRAIEKPLVSIEQLRTRHCELARRGRPGTRALRSALELFDDGPATASTFERDFEGLLSRYGFVAPVRQFRVEADGHVYFLDHAWPDLGVWSECDSMLAHGSAEALRKDLERQNRITLATGLEPLRFTYFDVHERPEYVADILARRVPRSGRALLG